MPHFTPVSELRTRERRPSAQPALTGPGTFAGDASGGDAAQRLLFAGAAMVVDARQRDQRRTALNSINNAKQQFSGSVGDILADRGLSPEAQAQAIQKSLGEAFEGVTDPEVRNRLTRELAPILSRSKKTIDNISRQLLTVEANRSIDGITIDTDLDEFVLGIKSLGMDPVQQDNMIREGEKKFSGIKLIGLVGDALTAETPERLAEIDEQVRENSKFVGLARARFDVFGKAAKAAAENGLVDRTKRLLEPLGNDFAEEQTKIVAIAETRFHDIDHVGRITTALIKGKVEPGQRLSTLPKHLNEARANVALQGVSLGGQIDAFKQLGLPLPSSIKDDLKASFDSGDIRGGMAALQTLNAHSPGEAARLRDEIGPKATTIWDEAFRDGSSPQSVVDAMDALSHPRADSILDLAADTMRFDKKVNPLPMDPVEFVFKSSRAGFFSSETIKTTSKQRGEIESQFKLQLLKQSIRDDLQDIDIVSKAVAESAAKRAALIYQQNYDKIVLFDGSPNNAQLLSRNLGVEPQNIPRFQQSVSTFETFADNQASDSRVLVNRTFNLGQVTYVPAVSDLGGVVGFMAFDRINDEFRNTSSNRNSQEFNEVLKAFSSSIRPGQLDIYDGVRRRAGESEIAEDAGGEARVNGIIQIAKRQWLIDNGAKPDLKNEEEAEAYQIYLDRATKRAGFRSLMVEGGVGGEVPQ